jgi:hypothetical protein
MDSDKDRFAAIAARGEQIKTNSAEFLWICKGVRPSLLPDKSPAQLRGVTPGERRK